MLDKSCPNFTFSSLVLICFWIVAAAWATPAGAAQAEQEAPPVTVVALRGEVIAIDAAGVERPLRPGDPVAVTDTIRTGPTGRLQIMFTDNTIISLGVNAEMEVSRYQWDERQGELSTTVNQGAFRVMGGAITRVSPENFTTETPSATIGIRGSMYAGRVSNGTLTVVFQGGAGIVVSNPAGRVEITTPGMGTRVRTRNDPPDDPAPFSDDDLAELEDEELEEEDSAEDEAGDEEAAEEEDAAAEETSAEEETTGDTAEDATDDEWENTALDDQMTDDSDSGTNPATAGEDLAAETATTASQDEITQEAGSGAGTTSGRYFRFYTSSYSGSYSNNPILGSQGHGLEPTGGSYTGRLGPRSTSRTIDGTVYYGDQYYDNTNSFQTTIIEHQDVNYLDFSGLEATSLSGSGILRYAGLAMGAESRDESISGAEVFELYVNRNNNKAIGIIHDHDYPRPTFFFGTVDGTSLANVRVLDTFYYGTHPNEVPYAGVIASSAVFSRFYGADAQGFGFTVDNGRDYNLLTGVYEDYEFAGAGGAFRDLTFSATPRTDNSSWEVHTVRMTVTTEVADPANKTFSFHRNPTPFALAVNRSNGTISGTFTPDGWPQLFIGGSNPSAYVGDHLMVAEIGGSGLRPHGNYLLTAHPDDRLADHVSWGYWESSRLIGGDDYLEHATQFATGDVVAGSLWVGGEPTSSIDNYVAGYLNGGYTGSYSGEAVAVHYDGATVEAIRGPFDMNISFSDNSMSGTIFSGSHLMNFSSGPGGVTAHGISGTVELAGNQMISGPITGTFFGPEAASVGGNFEADYNNVGYLGVFGADKVGDFIIP